VASVIIRFVIPVVFIIELDWSVCICLTQLCDGIDMYRIYYIISIPDRPARSQSLYRLSYRINDMVFRNVMTCSFADGFRRNKPFSSSG